jgi:hypothetical protein
LKTDTKYLYPLSLLYFIVSLIGVFHHELWLDESHHWLLARDSNSFLDFIRNTRSEGHPVLWDFLVFVITRFTLNPLWMQVLHILISTAVVYLFLRKAPFSRLFKLLFIFGYFMIFEYNLISRNYILGVLFLFLACSLFKDRNTKFILLSTFLALAANVHLMFSVIAFALFLIVFWERFQNRQLFAKSSYAIGYIVFGIGLLSLFFQIASTDSDWFFETLKDIPLTEKFTKGFISLFKGLIAIPDFNTIHFWNSNLLVNFSKPLSAILGLLVYAFPLVLFFKKKKMLLFVYVALIGTQIFFFITQRGGARFDGITYLIIIIALWIENDFDSDAFTFFNPMLLVLAKKPIVYSILLIHFCSGIYAYTMDYRYPFTASKETVVYLKSQNLDKKEIITITCDGTLICPYLEKKVWFLCDSHYESYCHWDFSCAKNITRKQIAALLADYLKTHGQAVYVSTYPILTNLKPNQWTKINNTVQVRLLARFDQHIILRNSGFYIFEISKI